MARKLRLTPFQGRLLWLLEEAGKETMPTIIATLKPTDQAEFDRDLAALVRLGLVSVEGNYESVILTAAGRQALTR
jgi:hypothetical protein